MPTTHTLVIGGGQAGLAMSRCLADAAVDHVVLERGRIAQRWRSERWDSLRLLSPNWATRLPGWSYQGPDPDGYMTAAELVGYLTGYARSFDAPIAEQQDVVALRRHPGGGFTVDTTADSWRASNVVIATGWCDQPRLPAFANHLPAHLFQATPDTYRNPAQLPEGRVLVVGASATGVQLAEELALSGREVVLAVGRHSRITRRYRGMDIWWWLEQIGTFAKTIDAMADEGAARNEGALQLVGRADYRDVDLPTLQHLGVRLAGRLTAVDSTALHFADDLATNVGAADTRLARLLATVDDYIDANGLGREVLSRERFARTVPSRPAARIDVRDLGTVVWATGYRRPYPWLQVPVRDEHGEIIHRRGVTPAPGLYVIGQRFQHRRDSNFIDGVRHDAHHLAQDIARRRADQPTAAAQPAGPS